MIDERALLRRMFEAAVDAAQPVRVMRAHLPTAPAGRTIVVGAGKASAAMAHALEAAWTGPLTGVVVTRYGHAVTCRRIEVIEASHPIPDEAGVAAARRILESVQGLSADDLVICLISGGGSSLLPLPLPGVSLADKQQVGRALLASGATIGEINCVRRHLSAVKGGRLAAASHPAQVVTLAISDVPGDNPIDIASGPTIADPTTIDDARAVLAKYRIETPAAIAAAFESPLAESVKPADPRLQRTSFHLIATPQMALEAAAAVARAEGFTPLIISDCVEGEARDVGKVMAAVALQVARHRQPVEPPCVLLSGGETTVTVRGKGRGAVRGAWSAEDAVRRGARSGVRARIGGVIRPGRRFRHWCRQGQGRQGVPRARPAAARVGGRRDAGRADRGHLVQYVWHRRRLPRSTQRAPAPLRIRQHGERERGP